MLLFILSSFIFLHWVRDDISRKYGIPELERPRDSLVLLSVGLQTTPPWGKVRGVLLYVA
jgi:hypothetical protein